MDQGGAVRLETRAGESTVVASLRGLTPEAQGNRQARSHGSTVARGGVPKGPESLPWDQKPGDLGGGRAKPGETPVEARKGSDVQFVPMTPV